MINQYFYDEQLRSYILQFCAIFSGMQVKTGKGEDGTQEFIDVPINVGNRDRVVAAIMEMNSHNRPFSLPQMSAYMSSLELAPERRKGVGSVFQKVSMPAGGVFPDDLKVVKRLMPIPYNITMELSIYASNLEQMHQILEQILLVFDPQLQIQTSDAAFDWTKITIVELTSINNDENYSMGTDKRILTWTLSFHIPIYLSAPLDKKDDLVKKIVLRVGDLSGLNVNEYDENGELRPFSTQYSKTTVSYDGDTNINY